MEYQKKYLVIDEKGQIVYQTQQSGRIFTFMFINHAGRTLKVFRKVLKDYGSDTYAPFYTLDSVYVSGIYQGGI